MKNDLKCPSLSVIVPMYNAESLIVRCVQSLFKQTISDIQYIFIDDCSTDNTVAVLEEFIKKYHKNSTIVRNKKNIGQSLSRKKGMDLARGEYITFVDADDWVEPDMYEIMLKTTGNYTVDIVTCDYYEEYPHKQVVIHNVSDDIVEGILNNTIAGSLWNKIFRRDLFDSTLIWPSLNMGEDGAICVQLLSKCKSILHVNCPLYHYYINSLSTVNSQSKVNCIKRFKGLVESTGIIIDTLNLHNLIDRYRSAIFFRKVYIKLLLSPIADDDAFNDLMDSIYNEITLKKVLLSSLPAAMKLRYILLVTRLYPKLHYLMNTLMLNGKN